MSSSKAKGLTAPANTKTRLDFLQLKKINRMLNVGNPFQYQKVDFFLDSWFRASWFNVNKKIQLDATVGRHLFTAKSLYVFRASQHPSSGALKTVTATSGIGHNTGTATSFQRGLFRTSVSASWRAHTSPEQATLEGSSCTSIMTYTRGSGYSF